MHIDQPSSPPMLVLTDAALRLAAKIFGPFTFSVRAGERIAILGPSGAGKSTLLKMLAREMEVQAGGILLHQRPLRAWSLAELSVVRAVLPQSHDVAFGLPTDLVIALGRVARSHDPQLAAIVRQSADLARATNVLGRRFDTLSGGEKARVQLARVFAQLWDVEQGVMLVDEPLAALDPGLQFQLMDAIDSFASARGHTIIAIVHDINHALQGFARLLLIKAGRLIGDVPSNAEAIAQLAALYEIELISAVNQRGDTIVTPVRAEKNFRRMEAAA